ncbi:MAG: SLC13 family permease [Phycisphaerales bacterium]|nr:MAG: SLC13 family permease [Phycisphaerales bacterium]
MMTAEIAKVLIVLAVTVVLFVSELFRVDVVAIVIMLAVAWLGLVSPSEAFSGFASNAVVSIIAVMILGYGVDRSGVMRRITGPILRVGGSSEKRLTATVCSAVGLISAFMQNIGAAALFLPAILRISKSSKIPISRLLMPMGFAAILGGTLTMVASGPLIILNDLLKQGGHDKYGLFSVTPVGLALLAAGIAYFVVFGGSVLPAKTSREDKEETPQSLADAWKLPTKIFEYTIPEGSGLVGKTREQVALWKEYKVNLVALAEAGDMSYAPWRHTRFAAGQELALIGEQADIERLATTYKLQRGAASEPFEQLKTGTDSGLAELVIPPRSVVAGRTLRQIALRKNYSVEPIMLLRGAEERRGDFSDAKLQSGDAMLVYGPWQSIRVLDGRAGFVLVTPVEGEVSGRPKPKTAIICFIGALVLVLAGAPLPVALLSGALAMVVLRVITIDQAYRAVDWRTVFLLAGLIPLGIAMEKAGAAAYLANQTARLLGESHALLIMAAFAVLTTVFSLFMSNVAATVLLVPTVMVIAGQVGISPRALALLVAVCASNSFVLPTHQVNALLMSPGGYRNADYIKAGGIMTAIFVIIAVALIYLLYA